jgi:hypothetical protein
MRSFRIAVAAVDTRAAGVAPHALRTPHDTLRARKRLFGIWGHPVNIGRPWNQSPLVSFHWTATGTGGYTRQGPEMSRLPCGGRADSPGHGRPHRDSSRKSGGLNAPFADSCRSLAWTGPCHGRRPAACRRLWLPSTCSAMFCTLSCVVDVRQQRSSDWEVQMSSELSCGPISASKRHPTCCRAPRQAGKWTAQRWGLLPCTTKIAGAEHAARHTATLPSPSS